MAYLFSASSLLVAENIVDGIEKVDVIAAKQAASSEFEINNNSHTGFVKSIDRESFSDRFINTADLLDELTGVQVKQTGGYGSFSSTSIRGASGKQVNFYLDGILLNSPYDGTANLNQLPSALIQSIDVYPGSSPLELSNANLAGAVNFTSRSIKPNQNGGEIGLAYGSFNTTVAEWGNWFSTEDWEVVSALSSGKADNDYPLEDDIFVSDNDRQNNAYKQTSGLIKATHQSKSLTTEYLLSLYDDHKDVPSNVNLQIDDAYREQQSGLGQLRFAYQIASWNFKHSIYYANENHKFNDENGTVGLRNDKSKTKFGNLGTNNTAQIQLHQHELTAGLELSKGNITQQQDDGFSEIDLDADRTSVIFSLADHWYITEQFQLSAQARHYEINDTGKFTGLIRPAPDTEISNQTWHLGTNYYINESFLFKSNLSKTLRLPTFFEKFGDSGNYIGNPYLTEEIAHNFDIGLNYKLPEKIQFETSFFIRDIKDGIFNVFNSQGVGGPKNISESRLIGIEAEALIPVLKSLTLRLSLLELDSENLSSEGSAEGNYLPGIYHHDYLAALIYNESNHKASIEYQIKDELYYALGNAGQADTRKDLNISYTYSLSQFDFNASINNLLDKNYQDFQRTPTPGRSASLKITYSY